MHVELRNAITLQMEIDYGGIKILDTTNGNNIQTRYLIRLRCAYGNITKGGSKTHLERKT